MSIGSTDQSEVVLCPLGLSDQSEVAGYWDYLISPRMGVSPVNI